MLKTVEQRYVELIEAHPDLYEKVLYSKSHLTWVFRDHP